MALSCCLRISLARVTTPLVSMQVATRSTPADFILDTWTDRSAVPKARDLSSNTTLAPPAAEPYLSKLLVTPLAQSADWATE